MFEGIEVGDVWVCKISEIPYNVVCLGKMRVSKGYWVYSVTYVNNAGDRYFTQGLKSFQEGFQHAL